MANPTNPNRSIRVKDLNRFKSKTDALYATKDEAQAGGTVASATVINDLIDEII